MTQQEVAASPQKPLKRDEVLSFKAVGRPIESDGVGGEFRLMQQHLKEPLTPEIATRVCTKSGTHLLKMVSARTEGDQACLYIERPQANERPKLLPAADAKDIPFCKVFYRPIEIVGRPNRSVIDDIMNPDNLSEYILRAFASVFGQDVVDAARTALLNPYPKKVTKLASGEFPIIFVPRPDGGDLQITPVSPAPTFMEVKAAINALYERKKSAKLSIPRGSFTSQSISSKPQNISGAIGGPRKRILAKMPRALEQSEAEIYRYVHGGSFPKWWDAEVTHRVLAYADKLDSDKKYNNTNTRAALDSMADLLVRDAQDFISNTVSEALSVAQKSKSDPANMSKIPSPAIVLIRRKWPNDSTYNRARNALTSAHFEHRMARATEEKETL